jgi:hypothetical protein
MGIEMTTLVPGWIHFYLDGYVGTWMDTILPRLMSTYLAGYMENEVNARVSEWIRW